MLENAVTRLRPIHETDTDNLLAIATQDKNLQQFSPAPIYTKELLQTYIDKAVDNRPETGATWYGKDFQRTGLNRNCKYLLLQYALDNPNAERVELKTDERNMASRIWRLRRLPFNQPVMSERIF